LLLFAETFSDKRWGAGYHQSEIFLQYVQAVDDSPFSGVHFNIFMVRMLLLMQYALLMTFVVS